MGFGGLDGGMDPQDSSKVFVPCPCEPCDERSSNNNYYNNPYINMGEAPEVPVAPAPAAEESRVSRV